MKRNNYLYNSNYLLLLLFVIICIIIYFLNIQIINSFRDETREQVRSLASEYSNAITNSNDDEIRFILDIMLPSLKFPMIIKNNNGVVYSKINIDIPYSEGSLEYNEYLNSRLSQNMAQHKSMSVRVFKVQFHLVT